jgi:predicted XRE-type DNA-binding protein
MFKNLKRDAMKKDVTPTNKVTRSSGNVFADLGLENASEQAIKARLVLTLARIIEASELSQTAAARRIGIAQPDLSKILRGNFSGFSLERLLGAALKLGSDVEIKVQATKATQAAKKAARHGDAAKDAVQQEGRLCLVTV